VETKKCTLRREAAQLQVAEAKAVATREKEVMVLQILQVNGNIEALATQAAV
jgi:hypothetical protein